MEAKGSVSALHTLSNRMAHRGARGGGEREVGEHNREKEEGRFFHAHKA